MARKPDWITPEIDGFCQEHHLLPMYDKPGWAWHSGNDLRIGQWVPVSIEEFAKEVEGQEQQDVEHAVG
jgi:hypothetical protein